MIKVLLIIFEKDTFHLFFKINNKWQNQIINSANLSDLELHIAKFSDLTSKSVIYVILNAIHCSKMSISKPDLKIDYHAMNNLIQYHFSEQEMSTDFIYDYKIINNQIEIRYITSKFSNSLMQLFKGYDLKFIGSFLDNIKIDETTDPKSILASTNNSSCSFIFLPYRSARLVKIKKQIMYIFLSLIFFGICIPFGFRIFLLKQQAQYRSNFSIAHQYGQELQTQLDEVNSKLAFFECKTNTIENVHKFFSDLTQHLAPGIWLTALYKHDKDWQIEGEALAEFLIQNLVDYYHRQLNLSDIDSDIDNKGSVFSFTIKLKDL